MTPSTLIVATSAGFILCLLLVACNLWYATNWGLVLQFLYYTLPVEVAAEFCVTHVSFAMAWAITIGISIITLMDHTIMDMACEQYGCALSWSYNVILHYIPSLLQTFHILYIIGVRRLLPFLLPSNFVYSFAVVLCIGLEYCFFMDPAHRYYLQIEVPTFLALLLAAASGALLAIACCAAVWVAKQPTSTPTCGPGRAPSASSTAAANTRGPVVCSDLIAQQYLPPKSSYQVPPAPQRHPIMMRSQSVPWSQHAPSD